MQKELKDFGKFPKQYILLNCNPVIAVPSMGDEKPIRSQDDVDQTIKDLRMNMEGDKQFYFTEMLKFDEKKENFDNIKAIKEEICRSIGLEDKMIEREINELKKLNLTRETIEKGSYDLSGISQTSLLIYANEYLAQLEDKGDKKKEYSFKCRPG